MKRFLFVLLLAPGLRLAASDPAPVLAVDWCNRGAALFMQGAYRPAEQLFVQARDLAARDGSTDPFDVSTILLNLAAVYLVEARYAEAEPLYLETIRTREMLFGLQHSTLLGPLKGLTLLYINNGRFPEAASTGRRALELETKIDSAPSERAETLNNLALVSLSQRRWDEAEKLAQQSLAVIENQPQAAVQSAEAWNILGRIHLKLLRYGAAQECFEKAASLVSTGSRKNISLLAIIWKNLADLEAARHNWARGKELAERSAASIKEIYGPRHPELAAVYSTLGGIEAGLKHYGTAERLYSQGLAIDTEAFGVRSGRVASDLSNLGVMAFRQGHLDKASTDFSHSLANFSALLDPQSVEIGVVCANLAQVYTRRHLFAEAEPLLKRAADIREAAYGSEDPTLADILSEYVVVLRSEKRYGEAALVEVRAGGIRVKNALRTDSARARE